MKDTYQMFCEKNKDHLQFQLMRCIDDKTMQESYVIETNVLCDGDNYYISKDPVNVHFKRRDFRRRVALLSKILGRKPRLVATSNGLGYTRLIYKF